MSNYDEPQDSSEESISASTILVLGISLGIAAERLIWTGNTIGIGFATVKSGWTNAEKPFTL